jgi:hypothetical protein
VSRIELAMNDLIMDMLPAGLGADFNLQLILLEQPELMRNHNGSAVDFRKEPDAQRFRMFRAGVSRPLYSHTDRLLFRQDEQPEGQAALSYFEQGELFPSLHEMGRKNAIFEDFSG